MTPRMTGESAYGLPTKIHRKSSKYLTTRSVSGDLSRYCRLAAHLEVLAATGRRRTLSVQADTPTRSRHWSPYLFVAGLFGAVPGVLLLIGYLVLPDSIVSGECEGNLFGCGLSPKDGVVVIAMCTYPFSVAAGLAIMAVLAIGRACRRPR